MGLHVEPQKSVECNHFAGGGKFLGPVGYKNLRGGLFQLGVGHLAGHGPFPDQVVEAFLLRGGPCLAPVDVGGPDRFVRLLRSFAFGGVLPGLVVFGAEHIRHRVLGRPDGERGEVHRVGTHVGDKPGFVKPLRHAHGLAHGKS